MSLVNFWEYVIENGWRVPNFAEDEDGNYICPFCQTSVKRKVKMDDVPVYEDVIDCPCCGVIESE